MTTESNAPGTIVARKPQFRRSALIAAIVLWLLVFLVPAGWIWFAHHGHNHGLPASSHVYQSLQLLSVLITSAVLFACGVIVLIVAGIDFALRTRRYRTDLQAFAASSPVPPTQP